jgi:hypothetical protein
MYFIYGIRPNAIPNADSHGVWNATSAAIYFRGACFCKNWTKITYGGTRGDGLMSNPAPTCFQLPVITLKA